jgi:hypothetical protein
MVQSNRALFYSIATHFSPSQPLSGCKYSIKGKYSIKEGKNYDVQYIILFMFLWDPTSSQIFFTINCKIALVSGR